MKRFIVGDIHGAYKALRDVLEKANFNEQEDILYAVGDYTDGWPETYEVIEYLSNLPNFRGVIGNHDEWLLTWLKTGHMQRIWTAQGGAAAIDSYLRSKEGDKDRHAKFLGGLPYYLVEGDTLICHGGLGDIDYEPPYSNYTLVWDRDMFIQFARACRKGEEISLLPYKRVFIGHTQTSGFDPSFKPFSYKGLWNIDQGGGWNGKLTLVNMDTDDIFQSEFVREYYPDVKGRD